MKPEVIWPEVDLDTTGYPSDSTPQPVPEPAPSTEESRFSKFK